MFPELLYARVLLAHLVDRARGEDPERGDVMQWVLVIAIGVTMAITVGAIVLAKVSAKATSIDTTTPLGG